MFFDRLIRDIVIFFGGFVIAINIYLWGVALQFGTQDTFHFVGFYQFFKNFETMPKFETFLDSFKNFANLTQDLTGWRGILGGVTFGLSVIVEFVIYLVDSLVCVLWDLIRIIIWLCGFIGADVSPTVH